MDNTFPLRALGDYLAIDEPLIGTLVLRTFKKMNPNALTEDDIKLILKSNPKLMFIKDFEEFMSWYYLEYCVNKEEAKAKRFALIGEMNWLNALQTAYRNF